MSIYHYWFTRHTNPIKWFTHGKDYDLEIKSNYQHYLDLFSENLLLNWEENTRGILSLIILLDQFPRHIYREMKEAYSYDLFASQLVLRYLFLHTELEGWEKVFFLMPLQHQENLAIQEFNKKIWEKIIKSEENDKNLKIYQKAFKNVEKHYQIIKRFKRFPKRNHILERENTEEEREYLKENPLGFI
jgi:uncharacterized protein (DUF924 family)